MIIRIRSKVGTERIEIEGEKTLGELKTKIAEQLKVTQFFICKDPKGENKLEENQKNLELLGFKNGEMIYLFFQEMEEKETTHSSLSDVKGNQVEEDAVDQIIAKMDGWTERKTDERYCKHGPNGKCLFCIPIAPWNILEHDPWKKDGIKFLPFHSYVRKMQQATPMANKSETRPVWMPSYKVKNCNKHAPWPEGICSECQPSAIRVDSQPYRHVDHVEFQSMEMVNQFIQYWRETGNQRVGFLYGKYVAHDSIPLGIRAQVMAIYEPPQKSIKSESILEQDPNEEKVDLMAASLGLSKIGFIWTDLILDSNSRKPQPRDFLLSSSEVIRAAKMQNKHPSPCKQSMNQTMGSKFVNFVVKANKEGAIEVEGYQVSDQCMAMVRDGIVTVSKNVNMLRVKKSKKNFVPDVHYSDLNEYKISVIKTAAPTVPSEFFIVPLGHGAAKDPSQSMFPKSEFPIENRDKPQSKSILSKQLAKFSNLRDSFSDFHLLVYLSLNLSLNQIQLLGDCLKGNRQTEPQIESLRTELIKEGQVLPHQNIPTTSSPTPSVSNSHPQESQLMKQMIDLGIGAAEAKESLFATNYVGVEAALDYYYNSR